MNAPNAVGSHVRLRGQLFLGPFIQEEKSKKLSVEGSCVFLDSVSNKNIYWGRRERKEGGGNTAIRSSLGPRGTTFALFLSSPSHPPPHECSRKEQNTIFNCDLHYRQHYSCLDLLRLIATFKRTSCPCARQLTSSPMRATVNFACRTRATVNFACSTRATVNFEVHACRWQEKHEWPTTSRASHGQIVFWIRIDNHLQAPPISVAK